MVFKNRIKKVDKLIKLVKDKLPKKMVNRKLKIPIEKKIEDIFYLLRTGISWRDLGLINKVEESNYRKFFYKLNKLDIFDSVMKEIRDESELTFIDSSVIVNKCGKKESIGFCPQNKKHKGNKVSLIVNEKGKPLSCKIDKSSVHDLKLLNETIKDIKTKTIVGDKGYTSKNVKEELKDKGIKMLVPNKRNSNWENSPEEKKLLKKRYIVENSFCNLKKLKRLGYRYEVNLENFIGFVKLGLIWLMIS